jgi:DNA-directed RNA polymerase subunit RPC12/RpoP
MIKIKCPKCKTQLMISGKVKDIKCCDCGHEFIYKG